MGPDTSPGLCRPWPPNWAWTKAHGRAYVSWMRGLLAGNLGLSYAYSSPCLELIVQRLGLTDAADGADHGAGFERGRLCRGATTSWAAWA